MSLPLKKHIISPKPFKINFFGYAGFQLTNEYQAKAFAKMLNDSDSCHHETYDQLVPTYQFLSPTAKTFVAARMVPLQDKKIEFFLQR